MNCVRIGWMTNECDLRVNPNEIYVRSWNNHGCFDCLMVCLFDWFDWSFSMIYSCLHNCQKFDINQVAEWTSWTFRLTIAKLIYEAYNWLFDHWFIYQRVRHHWFDTSFINLTIETFRWTFVIDGTNVRIELVNLPLFQVPVHWNVNRFNTHH